MRVFDQLGMKDKLIGALAALTVAGAAATTDDGRHRG